MLSKNLRKLAEIFHKTSPLYLVGGYVRDFLLFKSTKDIDICSKLTILEVDNLLKDTPYKTKVINEKLGTVLITINNEKYEYTPFRKDNYALTGEHMPVSVNFNVTINEDALRRDFTVNAIYYDIFSEQFIDVVGGRLDLENRVLKSVNTPSTVFKEDALRIYRLVRLSVVLGFDIENNTFNEAKKLAPLIKNLASERVVEEYKKVIEKSTSEQVLEYVNLLGETSVIENWYEKGSVSSYKMADSLIIFQPNLLVLYLAIFERYFYEKTSFASSVNLNSLASIKIYEQKLEKTFSILFDKDRLSNKEKKQIYKFLTFSRLFFEAKNQVHLDILLCRYYNIIISLIMGKESKIMVKNSIFTDIISRLDYLSSIPKTVLDLAITAEDLILLGVKKQNLNLTFDGILFAIFSGKLQNTKESIIKFITEKK